MSSIQAIVCWTNSRNERAFATFHAYSLRCTLQLRASSMRNFQYQTPCFSHQMLTYRRVAPVCVFGGQGNSNSKNEGFSWDSLKNAMEGLKKEPPVQDILRQQMLEKNFDGDGGGRIPPGGGGDGSGGAEDEGFAGIIDEFVQVILATIFFIFVYIYMIRGEELTRLAKDYIKYLFGARTSVRLRRAMYKWRRFWESITRTEVVRENWLERAIVATPTWWHKPRRLARAVAYGELKLPALIDP